jgi:2-C-methyl-D-erythritol 4-phosphate cytidylyltransferase
VAENDKPGSSSGPRYWIVIPAAGVGKRIQASTANNTPKQYLQIQGRTILEHTIVRLQQINNLAGIVLVLGENDDWWSQLNATLPGEIITTTGGEQRANSVYNGLQALKNVASAKDWILVHDAIRPCVSLQDISTLCSELTDMETGGLLASPVRETLKKVSSNMMVESTVPREDYWLAATPQMFRYGVLIEAIEKALLDNVQITDEAHAMEYAGHSVKVVQGSADNIKITHVEDIFMAQQILNKQARQ